MIHTVIDSPENDFFFKDELPSLQTASNPLNTQTVTPPVPAALEKTRMCVYYLQGRCKYDDCSFAHSVHELKQAPSNLRKTKICDLYMMGHCYDTHCNFAHSTEELKVKPKRSGSSTGAALLSTSVGSPSSSNGCGDRRGSFDKSTHNQNVESCARTILSMLIKMQPEAAVAFLSNPECKAMLSQLLDRQDLSPVAATAAVKQPVPPQIATLDDSSLSTSLAGDSLSSTINSSSFLFASPTGSDIGAFSSPPGLSAAAATVTTPMGGNGTACGRSCSSATDKSPTTFANYPSFGINLHHH
jgi:hypothetical protein